MNLELQYKLSDFLLSPFKYLLLCGVQHKCW